jgi:hypothetical protein
MDNIGLMYKQYEVQAQANFNFITQQPHVSKHFTLANFSNVIIPPGNGSNWAEKQDEKRKRAKSPVKKHIISQPMLINGDEVSASSSIFDINDPNYSHHDSKDTLERTPRPLSETEKGGSQSDDVSESKRNSRLLAVGSRAHLRQSSDESGAATASILAASVTNLPEMRKQAGVSNGGEEGLRKGYSQNEFGLDDTETRSSMKTTVTQSTTSTSPSSPITEDATHSYLSSDPRAGASGGQEEGRSARKSLFGRTLGKGFFSKAKTSSASESESQENMDVLDSSMSSSRKGIDSLKTSRKFLGHEI